MPPATPPESRAPVLAALILGACFIQIGNGVLQVLLPVRLAEAMAPPLAVGAVASGYSIGFIAGCWAAPRLIVRIGMVRAFGVFALLSGAATLLLPVLPDPWAWTGLRMLMGVAYVGMLTVTESWLAARAGPEARGGVFSLYMVACKVAVVAGQMLLASPDLPGLWLPLTAAVCYALSLLPVAVVRVPPPPVTATQARAPWRHVRVSPVAFAGCLAIGLCNTAVIGIGPAYLAAMGHSAGVIALTMSGVQAGSVILQWPIGRLSDRRDRRLVILAVAGIAAVAALLTAAAGAAPAWVLFVLFTLWGSAALSLYAVCVAHANDHAPPGETVAVASALLLSWALGAAAGPLLATLAMECFGSRVLFVYAGAVSGGLALFAAWRRWSRPQAADT